MVSNEELDDLKYEVEELKKAVNELKNAIVDIRAAISELENPFNLLRAFPTINDLSALARGEVKKSEFKERSAEREVEEQEPKKEEIRESKDNLHVINAIFPRPTDFEEGFSILKWTWALMDAGMTKEDMVNITKYCERMGYLPLGASELVEYVVEPMFKARLGGLTLDEFLLIIYSAAKASGLKLEIKRLDDMAFSLLRKILKKIDNSVER